MSFNNPAKFYSSGHLTPFGSLVHLRKGETNVKFLALLLANRKK